MGCLPGSSVALSAADSGDPDGNAPGYRWWEFGEASSYGGSVTIQRNASATATVELPAAAEGQDVHVILELTGRRSSSLTAYRRVIINLM